ncbi:MAG: nuclear transport factor 2 family protein [Sciscionella sp.]
MSARESQVEKSIAQHLTSVVIESWYELDNRGGRRLAEFFTPDGVFDLGTARFEGRKAIAAAMDARATRGPRVTRHLLSNLRVVRIDETHGVVTSVLQLYGADGHPPLPIASPTAIGDIEDIFVRNTSETWLLSSRVFSAIFTDPSRFAPFAQNATPVGSAHG